MNTDPAASSVIRYAVSEDGANSQMWWKYLLTLAPSALALLQLAKDWRAHQTNWRRALVLILIVFSGFGAAVGIHSTQGVAAPPKAELESSLGNITEKKENIAIKQASVPLRPDGTISFTVYIVNKSEVDARDGSIIIRVCQTCKFSREPQRFKKAIGSPDSDREMRFEAIQAMMAVAVPLEIKPPEGSHCFKIFVMTGCETCATHPKESLYVNY
jgi:hypothetical protein